MVGCRPWVHFGRRLQCQKGRQPDVELHTRTASRKQALLLRNWHGQVFLMDLGSSHGTYLGHQKLIAHRPKEWRPGMLVFFADRQTESFELKRRTDGAAFPAAFPAFPAFPSRDRAARSVGISGLTSMAVKQFAGARRMMGIQLGEEITVRPKQVQEVEEIVEQGPEVGPEAEEVREVLYPGDWQVPADGLSKIGWKPEVAKDTAEVLVSGPVVEEVCEVPVKQPEVTEAPVPSGRRLAERLQQAMTQRFGPDVTKNLKAKGPRYPCPEQLGFQLDLASGRTAPYDPRAPALVLLRASVRPAAGLTRHIGLEWLSANVPSEVELLVRFSTVPLEEVNSEAEVQGWQLDLPLVDVAQLDGERHQKGTVSLSSFQPGMPQKLFVHLGACGNDGALAVFGSTLRLLDVDGDEWALDSDSRRPQQAAESAPLIPKTKNGPAAAAAAAPAAPASAPAAAAAPVARRRTERAEAESASEESSLRSSSVSHASTELVSDEEPVQTKKPKENAASRKVEMPSKQMVAPVREAAKVKKDQPQSKTTKPVPATRQVETPVATKNITVTKSKQNETRQTRPDSQPPRGSKAALKQAVQPRVPRAVQPGCAVKHLRSPSLCGRSRTKRPRKRSPKSSSPSRRSRSDEAEEDLEEELMKLSALKLVARLKADIVARRWASAPDFKNGRLRAAYSKALELLCDDKGGPV